MFNLYMERKGKKEEDKEEEVQVKEEKKVKSEIKLEPVGTARKAYEYKGRTNGNRPTWYVKGRLFNNQRFKLRVYDIEVDGKARPRKGDYGWDHGQLIVKNSDHRERGVAVLIPASYRKNFKASDCTVTFY